MDRNTSKSSNKRQVIIMALHNIIVILYILASIRSYRKIRSMRGWSVGGGN